MGEYLEIVQRSRSLKLESRSGHANLPKSKKRHERMLAIAYLIDEGREESDIVTEISGQFRVTKQLIRGDIKTIERVVKHHRFAKRVIERLKETADV